MKYPKIRAEWQPIGNSNIDVKSQELKIYKNSELVQEYSLNRWEGSLEFFIPAWDEKGHLIQDPTRIYYTVEAITDNFSSEVVASNVVELQSIAIDEKPTDLKVSVMPFPDFHQEYNPSNPNISASASIMGSGVI
tara:strand:+ start:408 stop:812 length:405 start_codon:yes stop_codon:yes gene_type:complete